MAERRRLGGWPGGVLAASGRTQARDACEPAGEDASVPLDRARSALCAGLLIALIAFSAHGAEKWLDAYNRGVAAVNGRNYKLGADLLQQAIAIKPAEATNIRVGNTIISVYTPHFFLGIARFNLGDVDGALREWRVSEEQGVITRTEYYANLKDWVARAQTEKQRIAQNAAAGAKKSADAAISRALSMQVDALSAGGDRTESYRNAQRRLQEAMSQFQKAGTNIDAYKSAETIAGQATTLFSAAAEEGKKLKAAQAARPVVKPAPPPRPVIQTPPPAPVKSEAEVAAEIAVQHYSRDVSSAANGAKGDVQTLLRTEATMAEALRAQLANAKSDAEFQRIAKTAEDRSAAMAKRIAELNAPPKKVVATILPPSNPATQQPSNPATKQPSNPAPSQPRTPAPPQPTPDPPTPRPHEAALRSAYRYFASGDLASAEQVLTRVLGETRLAEAYVLRGCARYTRAMLSRTPEAFLGAAADDFKAALAQNRALRLDPSAFSPKLVSFFEEVRRNGH